MLDEQRTVEIETKLAFQEAHIEELNQVVIAMQKQIDGLEFTCQKLKDKLGEIEELMPQNLQDNEKPPHY